MSRAFLFLDAITHHNYNNIVHLSIFHCRATWQPVPAKLIQFARTVRRDRHKNAMKIHNAYIRLISDKIIYLEEIGEGITYDIDKFIQELKRFIDPAGRRIICRDDMGHCDELQLDQDGQFYRFIPLPGDDPVIYRINSYFQGEI